jgi:hypothetical protein
MMDRIWEGKWTMPQFSNFNPSGLLERINPKPKIFVPVYARNWRNDVPRVAVKVYQARPSER